MAQIYEATSVAEYAALLNATKALAAHVIKRPHIQAVTIEKFTSDDEARKVTVTFNSQALQALNLAAPDSAKGLVELASVING